MEALWLENKNLSFRADLPISSPAPGEALLRLRLAGICSTDLEMARGYAPFTGIPGHEFVAEVIASPDPDLRGARVTGEINLPCGICPPCRAGHRSHCEQRRVMGIRARDGCFAEYFTLPLENLHRIPENVSDDAAVFTEPLAAALEIQQQIMLRPADRVLLIGAGRLGLLIAQTLALTGCDLNVVVRHEHPRALLAARGIATLPESQIPARRFDLVVEASGSPAGFALARRAVRPRGLIVLKSTYAGELQVDFSALVVDEITLVGSRCGPFEPALRLLATRQVDPVALIEARYSLAEGLAAFKHAARPGGLKVLLENRE
jgi:threonine dehydrogenase-like Zn-dependent dehydrogenase